MHELYFNIYLPQLISLNICH